MTRRHVVAAAACLALAIDACSKSQQHAKKKPMTTAERDSAIGESELPGAGVVKKAIEVSDSAEARTQRENRTP